ncbi:MAG: tetratricopeptide repeat protein, partial [Planctomycetes bacterium]|nr:tetratricopeptide repeat protein [Planctomycetota bacterium]
MNWSQRKLGMVLIGVVCLSSIVCGKNPPAKSQDVAVDAFKLRMKGKVDEATTLLEQAISKDPDNAAAHYELAR